MLSYKPEYQRSQSKGHSPDFSSEVIEVLDLDQMESCIFTPCERSKVLMSAISGSHLSCCTVSILVLSLVQGVVNDSKRENSD